MRLLVNFLQDYRRYRRHSSTVVRPLNRSQLAAQITMEYHRLEKGMALPQPRPGFGASTVKTLCVQSMEYLTRFGVDSLIETVGAVLGSYQRFHKSVDAIDADALKKIGEFERRLSDAADASEGVGGTVAQTRTEIEAATEIDYDRFVRTRHSVRQFADRPVEMALIEESVALAQRSPSVCNRQAWRVCVVQDRDAMNRVLEHQNGNRGFRHEIGTVIAVSSDLTRFTSVGERNQAWVDGGMFAMALVMALHSRRLGTCCLNTSLENKDAMALCREAGVPDNEVVIMLIAVGHLKDEFAVAASPRPEPSAILRTE